MLTMQAVLEMREEHMREDTCYRPWKKLTKKEALAVCRIQAIG